MTRTKIEIDISQVEMLAAQGLSQAEICLCLGISEDTLTRRKQDSADIAGAIKRGRAKAASEISNTLYLKAKNGDLGAIIWWEKTRRGLTDKVQLTSSDDIDWDAVPVDLEDAFADGKITLEQLRSQLRRRATRAG